MIKENEKISVVIPTYNQAKLLKKAIESVLKQTYTNWELIIVNNFSSDNTIGVISSYQDKRIKYFNFKNNGIIAASRNYGINKSEGKYISFLDSDDYWCKDKLQKSIEYLLKEYNFIFHNEFWIWSNGFKKKVNYGPLKNFNFERLLLVGNTVSTSTVTMEKKILKNMNGFSESSKIIGTEDYDLWLRISLKKEYKVFFINDYLGYYKIHSNNSSHKHLRQFKSELNVINKHSSNLNFSIFNTLKINKRKLKSLLGTLIKMNQNIYKISIKIRK